MRIVFTRAVQGETLTTIHRTDGVVVELPSFSRKQRVPHDLVHAVTERELGIADGVFGSIAAGAMFGNMRVVAGRPRHDAAARSRRILAANRQALTAAEILAGMLHHVVEGPAELAAADAARRGWGSVRQEPFPWTDAQIAAAVDTLRGLAAQWERVGRDGALEFRWPDRLVRHVPPERPRRPGR